MSETESEDLETVTLAVVTRLSLDGFTVVEQPAGSVLAVSSQLAATLRAAGALQETAPLAQPAGDPDPEAYGPVEDQVARKTTKAQRGGR